MKLEKFNEKDNKKKITIGISIVLVLLIAGIIVYRSFAFYEEKKAFDVIKGQVPNQNYDLKLSFYVDNNYQENMPEGTNYSVSVTCSDGATGEWDYDVWGPRITNLTSTRTKCKIYFSTSKNFIDVIKSTPIVTEGTGLYEVSHSDANITYTSNTTAINNLKQTELRYAGSDPNNYVLFNNELWRIIGLVNTPEGQRVKLVRNESIGTYSWDSSTYNSTLSINRGWGINEWSQADLMKLLNPSYESESIGGSLYWNKTRGKCYIESPNTIDCDFTEIGLLSAAKEMIDIVTWNTGATDKKYQENDDATTNIGISTKEIYNYERSNINGKQCTKSGTGLYTICNDTVTRTTSWYGKVGLIYPSDYGYASSGSDKMSYSDCLKRNLREDNDKCNNWISNNLSASMYTITPGGRADMSSNAYVIGKTGRLYCTNFIHNSALLIYPSVHLKTNIIIARGSGSSSDPYILENN